jgi:hypothetical protein
MSTGIRGWLDSKGVPFSKGKCNIYTKSGAHQFPSINQYKFRTQIFRKAKLSQGI